MAVYGGGGLKVTMNGDLIFALAASFCCVFDDSSWLFAFANSFLATTHRKRLINLFVSGSEKRKRGGLATGDTFQNSCGGLPSGRGKGN